MNDLLKDDIKLFAYVKQYIPYVVFMNVKSGYCPCIQCVYFQIHYTLYEGSLNQKKDEKI